MWVMVANVEPRGPVVGVVDLVMRKTAEEAFLQAVQKAYPDYEVEIIEAHKVELIDVDDVPLLFEL